MYLASDLAFKTIGGKMVFPSDKEVDRIMRENAKAAKRINPAKDFWSWSSKLAAKHSAKSAKGATND